MDFHHAIRTALTRAAHGPDEDVVEELSQHARALYERARADGASRDEARRRVDIQIAVWADDATRMTRRARSAPAIVPPPTGTSWTAGLLNDLRYAWRTLRHAPAVTAVIVLTLGLAIGANTAVFSIVNALVFEPLPYPEANRLVAVTFADEDEPLGRANWPHPKYAAFARHATVAAADGRSGVFDATAGYGRRHLSVLIGDQPHRTEAELVTAGYFDLLGVRPAAGRLFHPDEDRTPGEAPVIVVSDRFWRTHFGRDREALGQTVTIRDRPYEIVGILPPAFRGQSGTAEIWLTAHAAEHAAEAGTVTSAAIWWVHVIARLQPSTTVAQAEAEAAALVPLVDAEVMARMGPGEERYQLVPLKTMRISPDVRQSFVLLLGAVMVVLLIACANAANLLLGRAVARQREFAVRLAIGAGRGAIVRQLAVESLALALLAGALGLGVAWGALDVLTTTRPANTSGFWAQYMRTFEFFDVSLDARAGGQLRAGHRGRPALRSRASLACLAQRSQ